MAAGVRTIGLDEGRSFDFGGLGVHGKIDGADTARGFSVVHHPIAPRAVAYASSQAAVRHHTKSVALYCAEDELAIRCNAIQPAAILTPMWEPVLGTGPQREANLRAYAASAPLKRFGAVEEVAALAVHLASDESGFTTGAVFDIDGGMLAGVTGPIGPAEPG